MKPSGLTISSFCHNAYYLLGHNNYLFKKLIYCKENKSRGLETENTNYQKKKYKLGISPSGSI